MVHSLKQRLYKLIVLSNYISSIFNHQRSIILFFSRIMHSHLGMRCFLFFSITDSKHLNILECTAAMMS